VSFLSRLFKRERPLGHTGATEYDVSTLSRSFEVVTDRQVRGSGRETYDALVRDVSIVATGVRMFLDLAASSSWALAASEADVDGEYAKRAQQALMKDPKTKWRKIVMRAVLYRFYGFSTQEWILRRADDEDWLTFNDVAPRPQSSVTRWSVDQNGVVVGAWQSTPSGIEVFLPRERLVYAVDDVLTSSPFGLGIFQHALPDAERLFRYKKLEAHAFEADLRGVPVARAPLSAINAAVASGDMTAEQREEALSPVREFIRQSLRGPRLGVLLDSMVYTLGEPPKGTTVPHWNLDVLRGGTTSQEAVAAAIQRCTAEIARLLGIEQILLGSNGPGSYALSSDGTASLHLQVNATLNVVAEVLDADLLDTLWSVNGWSQDMKPALAVEQIKSRDVVDVVNALATMAKAGVPLASGDPAVNRVRYLLGLTGADPTPNSARDEQVAPDVVE